MNATRLLVVGSIGMLMPVVPICRLGGQEPDLRAQLTARGLPRELVDGVVAAAGDAAARGLPPHPLADKALEGWAKHVPTDRILPAVRQFAARMAEGREAARAAGMGDPPAEIITAAAEAIGRGMAPEQVAGIVRADGSVPGATAIALRVATALTAQGMTMDQAAEVVRGAMQSGRPAELLLDMPSLMRQMQGQGLPAAEIGRRMLGEAPGPGAAGPGRPGGGQAPLPSRPGMRPPGGGRPPGHRSGSGGNGR